MRYLLIAAIIAGVAARSPAGDLLPPVSDRYQSAPSEHPDFQRHVVPLLGRLGCNGRACHGSFQGQGGFRLSLFGYDFAADHDALSGGDHPRVNTSDPAESLILQKPTLAIDHEGGERFPRDGWEYRLLRSWIEAGAPALAEDRAELIALVIEPPEIQFAGAGDARQLRIIAAWSDGAREDVTPLCRFRSNDESIAEVSESGDVTAAGQGDTHVVAFYDNGIASVSVILPVSDRVGEQFPQVAARGRIDELVVEKLRKTGAVPSAICDDAEFLRRVSLDITGTLPTPAEAAAFLTDSSPEKRPAKIDELLERPTYAAWWATRLGDLTGNSEENLPVGGEQGLRREKSAQWYDWLYRRLEENTPYDEIAAGIVLARSRRPGKSDEDYFAEMSAYFRHDDPADFAARESMPYFWTPGRFTPSQTLRFSYAFLGVRLECAECHKHPYDQWTKDDYEGFQAFFEGVRFRQSGSRGTVREMKKKLGLTADQDSGGYKRLFARLAAEGTVVPWGEVSAPDWERVRKGNIRRKAAAGRVITPILLGGEEVLSEMYADPREPVMDWLRQPDNPYFARAVVNRVWANYFGKGIVEPPDDMNLANPPSNAPLLDYLAEEFVAQGYDFKWLHREIASSRTYQTSWRPNGSNAADARNFSRAQVRRLPAEVAYDAIVFATANDERQRAMQADPAAVRDRAIGVSTGYSRAAEGDYALKLFGKPARAINCDCERSDEPSLLQVLYLRNDDELLKLLDRRDGWLQQIRPQTAKDADADELISDAWRRTLSRPPTAREQDIALAHIEASPTVLDGLRDVLWALVNSKEFLLNH
ncbi:MAG: DUF1549 and DUF1553 domain-containing protein [Planctomycetes bacterium]|nr:DUF1549 and DUF1553 domain-containing protein [Planctomycetota bacterium]